MAAHQARPSLSMYKLIIEDDEGKTTVVPLRLLTEPCLAVRIGQSARRLAVERYAWSGAAQALESFYRRILEAGA